MHALSATHEGLTNYHQTLNVNNCDDSVDRQMIFCAGVAVTPLNHHAPADTDCPLSCLIHVYMILYFGVGFFI